MIYSDYASFYDSIYAEKDYRSEATQLINFLVSQGLELPARLLDIGSGSGRHLEAFRALGLDGQGIEPSQAMVNRARSRGLNVQQGYLDEIEGRSNNNVCTALFAVVNHIHPDKLACFLRDVASRLIATGFFALEVWGENNQPLTPSQRTFRHEDRQFSRTVVPRQTGRECWELRISILENPSGKKVVEENHQIYMHSFESLKKAAKPAGFFPMESSPIYLNRRDRFHVTYILRREN